MNCWREPSAWSVSSIDDVRSDLDLLIGRKPALVLHLDRAPGQREERFAHLLSGEVLVAAPAAPLKVHSQGSDLEARVLALEEEVARLRAWIETFTGEAL